MRLNQTDLINHSSSTRTLKLLVGLLIASNFLVGAISSYFIRAQHSRHAELISASGSVLAQLQKATTSASIAMRHSTPSSFKGVSAPALQESIATARRTIDADRAIRSKLLAQNWIPSMHARRDEFGSSGATFSAHADAVITLIADHRDADAGKDWETKLLPAYERHLASVSQLAEALALETDRLILSHASDSRSSAQLVLALASWPLLLGAALLLATLVFVVSLLVLFRVRESAD